MANEVMDCYVDEECFAQRYREGAQVLLASLGEEISCAVRVDSTWQSRFPHPAIDSLPRILEEIGALLKPLGMRKTETQASVDGELVMAVTLVEHPRAGGMPRARFRFVKRDGRFELRSVDGLCELLTRLSLAKEQQHRAMQNISKR